MLTLHSGRCHGRQERYTQSGGLSLSFSLSFSPYLSTNRLPYNLLILIVSFVQRPFAESLFSKASHRVIFIGDDRTNEVAEEVAITWLRKITSRPLTAFANLKVRSLYLSSLLSSSLTPSLSPPFSFSLALPLSLLFVSVSLIDFALFSA